MDQMRGGNMSTIFIINNYTVSLIRWKSSCKQNKRNVCCLQHLNGPAAVPEGEQQHAVRTAGNGLLHQVTLQLWLAP